MAERARTLGARLVVLSQPGRGTEVRLEIPLGREGIAND
jgi:signal transduction histidine kinase